MIRRVRPLNALVKSAGAQRAIQTWRGASVVHERARFAARELRGGATTRRYVLRSSGLNITLRHRTRDVAILNEIFGSTDGAACCYEPPPAVACALDVTPGLSVLDLGANIGLFGLYALQRWPGSTVVAYEPDPDNLALLRETIAGNGLQQRWTVVPAAASNAAGELSFISGAFSESRAAAEGEDGAISVPAVDLFSTDHHHVDFIKMDIEGGEWPILCDSRLSQLGARAIVLEWHSRNAPEVDARAAALECLRKAGYARSFIAGAGTPAGGVVWAWREA